MQEQQTLVIHSGDFVHRMRLEPHMICPHTRVLLVISGDLTAYGAQIVEALERIVHQSNADRLAVQRTL